MFWRSYCVDEGSSVIFSPDAKTITRPREWSGGIGKYKYYANMLFMVFFAQLHLTNTPATLSLYIDRFRQPCLKSWAKPSI